MNSDSNTNSNRSNHTNPNIVVPSPDKNIVTNLGEYICRKKLNHNHLLLKKLYKNQYPKVLGLEVNYHNQEEIMKEI